MKRLPKRTYGVLHTKRGTVTADQNGQQEVSTDDGSTMFMVGPQRAKATVGDRVNLTYITSPSSGLWYAAKEGGSDEQE